MNARGSTLFRNWRHAQPCLRAIAASLAISWPSRALASGAFVTQDQLETFFIIVGVMMAAIVGLILFLAMRRSPRARSDQHWDRHRDLMKLQAGNTETETEAAAAPPASGRPDPGAHAASSDVDYSGQDLEGVDWTGAHLAGAALVGANLARANLTGADLTGADLSGANLTGATLVGARMERSNLKGADLTGAAVDNARLHGAAVDQRWRGRISEFYGQPRWLDDQTPS